VQYGAEWEIAQISRCTVISNDPVWKHRERMRRIAKELSGCFHTKTAAAIRMVHERQYAAIRLRLVQRRKLAGLRAERFFGLFRVSRT
jgi:hypothetical protein